MHSNWCWPLLNESYEVLLLFNYKTPYKKNNLCTRSVWHFPISRNVGEFYGERTPCETLLETVDRTERLINKRYARFDQWIDTFKIAQATKKIILCVENISFVLAHLLYGANVVSVKNIRNELSPIQISIAPNYSVLSGFRDVQSIWNFNKWFN